MKLRRYGAALAAASLVLAACGGDDEETASADTVAASAEPTAEDTASAEPTAEPTAEDTASAEPTAEPTAEDTASAEPTAEDTAPEAGGEASQMSADGESVCGLGTGEAASGDAIKIGGVVTAIPGIAFDLITNQTRAYFDCVNANGGIYGHPIEYIVENDELDPAKAGAAAAKLVESDNVVALAGSTSILDCPVNGNYYTEQGIYAIIAGVPAECFGLPNVAAVNMGPHYSALGAAQAVVRAGAAGKMVAVTNTAPGSEYNNTGVEALAAQEGLDYESVFVETPISDADTVILDIVAKAGEGGGVTLTFTPPEMIKLMVAAENQGVIDDVIWGSATPANDGSVAQAVGPDWDGKLLINAEFEPTDKDGPDTRLYTSISEEFGGGQPLGSFGQMGFLTGRIMTSALLGMGADAEFTRESVGEAIVGITRFESDMFCKPWYFGDLPLHIPNNWDITVVPDSTLGKMVKTEECFAIAELDDPLIQTRAAEISEGLGENG